MNVQQLMSGAGFSLALALAGCSTNRNEHPVTGTVTWPGGDLAGHTVEVALATDPTVRGFGTIGTDGRFKLERLVEGKLTPGLPSGEYQARLILNDEGDGQTKKPKVPPRYLNFKTAGWSVQVPTTADVTLTLAAR
jgi:hypothetical protein